MFDRPWEHTHTHTETMIHTQYIMMWYLWQEYAKKYVHKKIIGHASATTKIMVDFFLETMGGGGRFECTRTLKQEQKTTKLY